MTYEAAFMTLFRGKKRHKKAFEVPCVGFNVLPEVFRRYSKKSDFLAVSYPLNLVKN